MSKIPVMRPPTQPPAIEEVSFIALPKDYHMPDEVLRLGGLAPQDNGNSRWWPAAGSKLWKIPQCSGPTYYRLIQAGTDHTEHWIRASRRRGRLLFRLLAADAVPQHVRDRVSRLKA